MYQVGDRINIKAEVLAVDKYGKSYQVKTESGEVFWVKEAEMDMSAAEAWEIARKLILPDGMTSVDILETFGERDCFTILKMMTAKEVKDKIEARKRKKDEIKVGDVVIYGENDKELFIVIADDNEFAWVYSEESSVQNIPKSDLHKTGSYTEGIKKTFEWVRRLKL